MNVLFSFVVLYHFLLLPDFVKAFGSPVTPRWVKSQHLQATTSTTLEGFMNSLSTLGKGRFITMRPDKSTILEATVDISTATIKSTDLPSGKTLLTLASPDKSFECHIDVGAAKSATLGISPKTGGPVIRVMNNVKDVICTIVIDKDRVASFDEIRAEFGDSVLLGSREGCRLLSGEDIELELSDMNTPLIIDCFARWCGPCQLMVPVMDEVAKTLGNRCRVVKFDTDEFPEMAEMLRVQGLPTLLFIGPTESIDGVITDERPKVYHRFEGAAPADHVLKLADQYLFDGAPLPVA